MNPRFILVWTISWKFFLTKDCILFVFLSEQQRKVSLDLNWNLERALSVLRPAPVAAVVPYRSYLHACARECAIACLASSWRPSVRSLYIWSLLTLTIRVFIFLSYCILLDIKLSSWPDNLYMRLFFSVSVITSPIKSARKRAVCG